LVYEQGVCGQKVHLVFKNSSKIGSNVMKGVEKSFNIKPPAFFNMQ
jgi:hypothetical protein